jgi:hypothetical protein
VLTICCARVEAGRMLQEVSRMGVIPVIAGRTTDQNGCKGGNWKTSGVNWNFR